MKFTRLMAALAAAGFMSAHFCAAAQPANTDAKGDQQKQVETIVHDYIIKNPEVVVQALQAYQQKQMEQAHKTIQKTQENAPKYADMLFHQANDPMDGNAKGSIVVVEFFDYQCSHCIDMTPILEDAIKTNPNLKVIYKEFPIRNQMSEYAAKAALAAKEQGKYVEFHKALMKLMDEKKQPLTENAVLDVAKSVGLDVEKLKTTMNSKVVEDQIKATNKLAQDLQLFGTPAFFIAKSDTNKNSASTSVIFVPGELDKNQLQAAIKQLSQ